MATEMSFRVSIMKDPVKSMEPWFQASSLARS